MSAIEILWTLQGVDREIDQAIARGTRARAAIGQVTPELTRARESHATRSTALVDAERAQRGLEWEVADRTARIRTLDERLYSGTIRNPKELTGMQTEIDHLRQSLTDIEEKTLIAIDAAEAARQAANASAASLQRETSAWEEDQAAQRRTLDEARRFVASERARREAITAQIPPPLLARYADLRKQKQGIGIVAVDRGTCTGCRTSLPTATTQAARTGNIVTCSSCGRIVYGGR
ncbi:MAG: hypothetical protein FJ033_09825 [Chloroflexi bacterium]|nr:hypothetical protein [Chloroflexota bacterium]